ncbi:MAG TPA: DUF4139 domain-containing protein [Saprospiraceae bacterium]|nr:DUF4139 domain-containing protein [Saprospiraceae bacterium]HPI06167.1 DUF4139 domain-containing protein [Saprospiraceae bacterium]
MRSFLFFAVFLCSFVRVFADNRVTPLITEVTVYRSGAKVSSTATVRVAAGNSEIVFENLSPYFNPASLQVKIGGSAFLTSAIFQMKTPGPGPESPRAPVLRDSLVFLGDDLTRIRDEREVLTNENNILNRKAEQVGAMNIGSPASLSLSVSEMRELSTFYRQRMLEIKNRLLELAIKERKINEIYRKMQETLQRLQPNTANQTGEIVLKIESAAAQSVEITCTYLVTQAGWTPLYDLRSAGLDKALRLIYKANVRNMSGFDWKDVRLHLSTANPLVNNNRPVMSPVFVDFRTVYAYKELNEQSKQLNTYNMAQVETRDMARGRAETPVAMDELISPEPLEPDAGDNMIASFDLSKPQTILADGQENVVTVDEQDVPAQYEYHAVPKLDPAVFLLAKITDYGKYNLLPGTANIFYQDTYVGQTFVNPQTVTDTMLISLGRDEQITIKRVQPKDFTERRKIFNSSIRETYAYEIAVKNNKSIPIQLEILDQIPVSRQKDIEVTLEEKDGAEYNETFGKLKWEVQVPANQSKRVRFTYSIKYPKDKAVTVVRD